VPNIKAIALYFLKLIFFFFMMKFNVQANYDGIIFKMSFATPFDSVVSLLCCFFSIKD